MKVVRLSEQDNVVTAIRPCEINDENPMQLIRQGYHMASHGIVKKFAQRLGNFEFEPRQIGAVM